MACYRVVTERWTVLCEPFQASDDRTAFTELAAHLGSAPPSDATLVGLQVQVGATWLDVGLWSPTTPRNEGPAVTPAGS